MTNATRGRLTKETKDFFGAVEDFLALLSWIEPTPTERQVEIDQIKFLVRNAACKIHEESPDDIYDKYLKLRESHNRQSQTFFLKHLLGQTYAEIGASVYPPISRQRVAQRVKKVEVIFNLKIQELRDSLQERMSVITRTELIDQWFELYGRLAIKSEIDPHENCDFSNLISKLNLGDRLLFYREHSLPIPAAEYDLQFEQISGKHPFLKRGKIWKNGGLDVLREYLFRRSKELGKPGTMPLQKEVPQCIIGAIERWGGINRVAKSIDFKVQGKLYGDNSRTYWNLDRLIDLAHKVNEFHSLPTNTLPPLSSVTSYIKSEADEVLTKKNWRSAYAAWSKHRDHLAKVIHSETNTSLSK